MMFLFDVMHHSIYRVCHAMRALESTPHWQNPSLRQTTNLVNAPSLNECLTLTERAMQVQKCLLISTRTPVLFPMAQSIACRRTTGRAPTPTMCSVDQRDGLKPASMVERVCVSFSEKCIS